MEPIKIIRPMLAHKWNEEKIVYPCFIQPKLNGIRGVYHPKRHLMVSREGEIWNNDTISHVMDELETLQHLGFHFDGEFYCHGLSLQKINSRISVVRTTAHLDAARVSYYIFDVALNEPFHRRHLVMRKLKAITELEHVRFVKTLEITSKVEADHYFNQWHHKEDFEGLMYRQASSPYGFAWDCGNKENRWNYLQKRKGIQDCYAFIVGMKQMIDDNTGELKDNLGSFHLQLVNGTLFYAGSGLNAANRLRYWRLGEQMNGTRVRINFEMYSDDGTPLKPVIDCVDYVL